MKKIEITSQNKNKFAYARVSTDKQLLDRQIELLAKHDIPTVHYYTDQISGTRLHRPGFDALLERLEPGDVLFVESFSRLSRSTRDLLQIVETLTKKGVLINSEKENFDTATATGKLMLTVLAALAQFERDLIAERTCEGLKAARARGHNGGRPKVDTQKLEVAFAAYDAQKTSVTEICKQVGIGVATFYKYNKIRKERKEN